MKLLNLYRPGDFFVSIKCTSFENAAYRVDRLVKKVNEFSSIVSRIKVFRLCYVLGIQPLTLIFS